MIVSKSIRIHCWNLQLTLLDEAAKPYSAQQSKVVKILEDLLDQTLCRSPICNGIDTVALTGVRNIRTEL